MAAGAAALRINDWVILIPSGTMRYYKEREKPNQPQNLNGFTTENRKPKTENFQFVASTVCIVAIRCSASPM